MTGKRAMIVLFAVVLAMGLAGCSAGSGAQDSPAATSGGSATTAAAPTIKVTSPKNGDSLAPGDVLVAVETTDLKFVMPGNKNVAGEGHVHFSLDGKPEQMSTTPSYTFKDVAAGSHTLRAQLVQNNTEPFDPPIFEEITFEVE